MPPCTASPPTAASPALIRSNIPNPNLKWESTAQFNLGLDLGLFDNRVAITLDAYNKQTKDLLLKPPAAHQLGLRRGD